MALHSGGMASDSEVSVNQPLEPQERRLAVLKQPFPGHCCGLWSPDGRDGELVCPLLYHQNLGKGTECRHLVFYNQTCAYTVQKVAIDATVEDATGPVFCSKHFGR